jgi:periplasmic protein TonB
MRLRVSDLLTREQRVPERKVIGTAAITSLVVHAAGLVALATWSLDRTRSRAQFTGPRQVIQWTVEWADPAWTPDVTIVDVSREDVSVLIEPTAARIAKRRYVTTPTTPPPSEAAPSDPVPDVPPRGPERERADDLPDESWDDGARNLPRHAPRLSTYRSPSLTRVEPPASLGDSDDTPPDLSRNAPPSYPAAAIQRGWEGTVLLRVWIDETGRVTKVEIARSSGHPVLDGAAGAAVRRWHGVPAKRGGQPAATIELLPVQFKL